MIVKRLICFVKGHDINPTESIVNDVMTDKRNWLCKCHRCGRYVMHDGAISGMTLTMSEGEAIRLKTEFELEMLEFERMMEMKDNDRRLNQQTSGD